MFLLFSNPLSCNIISGSVLEKRAESGGEDVDSVIIVGDKRVDKVLRKCCVQKVDSHGLYLVSEIKNIFLFALKV